MRAVQRWRFYCDFCKKTGGQKAAIVNHEASCTLNPNRGCRMCELTGESAASIADLLLILPDGPPPVAWPMVDGAPYPDETERVARAFQDALAVAMPRLREATQNCPACIMAALRQAKIPVPSVEGFDFKTEADKWLSEAYAARERYY